jgi:hypothetical protein
MTRQIIRSRSLITAASATLAGLALTACADSGSTTTATVPAPVFPTPLATSIETEAGSWATVAMGHLDDPNNTFWQLFFRPSGSTAWSDQVEATATATNGGLVLADRGGRQLVLGIRPSQDLHFTPMIATDNAGQTWTNGLLDAPLQASPNALAVSPAGGSSAIVSASNGQSQAQTAAGGISTWRTLISTSALASQPAGRACAPNGFNAVAYLGTTTLIGAVCTQPDTSAIFASQGSGWRTVGPRPPNPAPDTRSEVLGFDPDSDGVAALIGYPGQTGGRLLVSWTSDGNTWDTSSPLPVSAGYQLVSYGPLAGNAVFVLLASPDGTRDLYDIAGPGTSWAELPAPPPTTATVSQASNKLDALAVNDTTLTISSLSPSGRWTTGQTLHVAVQFGSSS